MIGKNIRKTALLIFIVSVVAMIFVALLGVWGVANEETLGRAIGTIVILAGGTGVIVMAANYLDGYKKTPNTHIESGNQSNENLL